MIAAHWTPDRVAELRRLWAEGLAIGEIARRLGITKNAVVGKAHRIGCAARPSPLKSPPWPRVALPVAGREGCRWIEGDDHLERLRRGAAIYCGKPATEPGGAWCALHKKRVYHRGTSRNWLGAA